MSDDIVDPTLAEYQLSFAKALGTISLREAEAKADFHENLSKQEHFKAAIFGLRFEEEQLALEVQKDAVQRQKQLKRPCMTLGVAVRDEMRQDGLVYVAQWSGLVAEGDTPEEACANFDRMWVGGAGEL